MTLAELYRDHPVDVIMLGVALLGFIILGATILYAQHLERQARRELQLAQAKAKVELEEAILTAVLSRPPRR